MESGANYPYQSLASQALEKKGHKADSKEHKEMLAEFEPGLAKKGTVKSYKSPAHFAATVKKISPQWGNPYISTSQLPNVTTSYADHPKKDATIHPQYDPKSKKPKHRLIGMTSVFVQEAGEYLARNKADIEQFRAQGGVGGKSAVERDNKEVIFSGMIVSGNVAGYVPLAYPNLSQNYSEPDRQLFGLGEKKPSLTRKDPYTIGGEGKKSTIYSSNQSFQWRLAEKYVKDRNPEGKLLWVDERGNFREFSRKIEPPKALDLASASQPKALHRAASI